jgi:hypothetical protein
MTEQMSYEEARERVQEIRGFFWHLFTYLIINAFMFVLNWLTGSGRWWFFWPMIGWGIGLAFHGAFVFIENGPLGKAWERRKIRELMGGDEPGGPRPGA